MKSNLLTLVQNTLSAMNSDEVDDIDETEEARQVTRICEEVFYDLQSLRNWAHKKEMIKLVASGDNTQPTRMQLPTNVLDIHEIRYNAFLLGETIPRWKVIKYLDPDDFLELTLNRDSTQDEIDEISDDVQNFTFSVYNDRAPEYYTSFDDEYIWFDSYDSEVDTTLQASKTLVRALVMVQFSRTNTYVPDIPNVDWALYRNTVVSKCFEEIKQVPAPTVTGTAKRLLIRAQKENGQRVDGQYPGVDYGR